MIDTSAVTLWPLFFTVYVCAVTGCELQMPNSLQGYIRLDEDLCVSGSKKREKKREKGSSLLLY